MMLQARPLFMVLAAVAAAGPVVLTGGGGAAAGTPLPPAAQPAALAGTWHSAIEVPGTAALNRDGLAEVDSVSCGSAGNCVAGGSYYDGSGVVQAFVASEVN